MNNIWQPMCEATSEYDILYCRLSRDDGNEDKESNSISHQKQILSEYAAQNGFNHPVFVVEMKIPKMIQFEKYEPSKKA